MTRFEVSAALDKLANQGWTNREDLLLCLTVVIQYGHGLPRMSPWSGSAVFPKSKGNSLTGHTPEQGEVPVDTDQTQTRQVSFGTEKDRVGKYRLCKTAPGSLLFHHFWKSSVETGGSDDGGDAPTVFVIQYDPKSLKVESFGYLETQNRFNFQGIFVSQYILIHLLDADKTPSHYLYSYGINVTMQDEQILLILVVLVLLSLLLFSGL